MVNMSKQTTHQIADIYQVFQKNFGKYFSEAEKSVPQYFQSVINYQKTYLDTWRNTVEAVFDVQRKYSQKAQINTQIHAASTKAIDKANDGLIKVGRIQEQYVNAAIAVTEENVKSFYESAQAFAKFYNNIVESWFTTFKNVRN